MARRSKRLHDQPIENTVIHSLSHEGRGIAQHQDKTLFIAGALPEEEIEFQRTYRSSRYDEGKLVRVTKASARRIEPPCPHASLCGGCSLQHMDTEGQLHLKQNTLLEQLTHFGKVTPEHLLAPLSGNTLGYRHKARLGVKHVPKKEKVLVGFREKDGRYVADLSVCKVLVPEVGERINELSLLIEQLSLFDQIPQIEVAKGDEHTALIIRHLAPINQADKDKLIEFAKQYQLHIFLQPNKPDPISKLYPTDCPEHLNYRIDEFNITIDFHPTEFIQINPEMNRLMIQQAITQLDIQPQDKVLDLFSGVGNFSLCMARRAKSVLGLEVSLGSINAAKYNAQKNGLTNTLFEAVNLFEDVSHKAFCRQQFDKILLDPPRSGAQEILPYLKKWQAHKIVYISCNPATLARDAGIIVKEYGYRLTHAGIINMFPHTQHVESMAVFVKE